MFFVIFIYASIGVEFFNKNLENYNSDYNGKYSAYENYASFNSLSNSLLILFHVITEAGLFLYFQLIISLFQKI